MTPQQKQQLKTCKLLNDIVQAGRSVQVWTASTSRSMFIVTDLLHSAVERKFIVIGEAMTRLRDHDGDTFAKLSDARGPIAFRNFLVHVYDDVDPAKVWETIEQHLPSLIDEAAALLDEIAPTN